jgi:hypothetical protein
MCGHRAAPTVSHGTRAFTGLVNVRYWHKADIAIVRNHVRFWGKADITAIERNFNLRLPQ